MEFNQKSAVFGLFGDEIPDLADRPTRTDPNHQPQSGVSVGNQRVDAFRGELVPPGASITK